MIDLDVNEAKRYKPEILALIKIKRLAKNNLELAMHPFSVLEMASYLLGKDSTYKFTHDEKRKLFPAIEYALDILECEGDIVYSGFSSTGERIYAPWQIVGWSNYKDDLVALGVIAPEETPVTEIPKEEVKPANIPTESVSCT